MFIFRLCLFFGLLVCALVLPHSWLFALHCVPRIVGIFVKAILRSSLLHSLVSWMFVSDLIVVFCWFESSPSPSHAILILFTLSSASLLFPMMASYSPSSSVLTPLEIFARFQLTSFSGSQDQRPKVALVFVSASYRILFVACCRTAVAWDNGCTRLLLSALLTCSFIPSPVLLLIESLNQKMTI